MAEFPKRKAALKRKPALTIVIGAAHPAPPPIKTAGDAEQASASEAKCQCPECGCVFDPATHPAEAEQESPAEDTTESAADESAEDAAE